MGKFRFEAVLEWKRGQESGKQKNIPIKSFNSGNGPGYDGDDRY